MASVISTYSHQVVGQALEERITRELVLKAAYQADLRCNPEPRLIFHSDRGSRFSHGPERSFLRVKGICQSMYARWYLNALIKSFFRSLKSELVELETFLTKA